MSVNELGVALDQKTTEPSPVVWDKPFMVITPAKGWFNVNFQELWHFRELLAFLTWRDVKVKYKQALLGFAWAVLVPVINTLVFGIIFGKIAGLSTLGIDPFVFYLTGLIPWQYFATAVNMASISMVSQQELLTKIYLPRLFMPTSACLASLLDYALSFIVMIAMILWLGYIPSLAAVCIPVLMLPAFIASLGIGFFFAALCVKYRDIKFVIPFLIQIGMYISVLISYYQLPERLGSWRILWGLNPVAASIEGCRWVMMHPYMFKDAEKTIPITFPWEMTLLGMGSSFVVFFVGILYFKRMEKMFADIV